MKSANLKSCALLVIDMQRYFIEPDAPAFLEGAAAIVPNVIKLVRAFRKRGSPVVFTRHAHLRGVPTGQMGRWWGDKLPWEGDKYSEIIKGLKPSDRDILITKARYSAFEGTELDLALKRQNIDTVCICGVMTNLCVETSARHAFMKDLQPVVVEDACAANTADHHDASILNLSYGFAYVESTTGLIGKLEKAKALPLEGGGLGGGGH